MNKSKLKTFAINARRWLIKAVSFEANKIGITKTGMVEPAETINKEVFLNIEGQVNRLRLPEKQYLELKSKLTEKGYEELIEEVSYTWFNRFMALRYMEINEYLEDGIKIIGSSDIARKEPDVISQWKYLSFVDSLDRNFILKCMTDHKSEELYKYLLIKQCNDMNKILPFMFEKISDYTEILFPSNIFSDDSVLIKMRDLDEEDWKEPEIIGWLYQFYNQEKKDDVFAGLKKNIKITKENIPAATQLFTPKWIVKYMVENSLGKLALESTGVNEEIKENWKYFIDNSKEKTINNEKIKLEDIKLIDPAMGSGHILVYGFEVLYQMYMDMGYYPDEAVKNILEKNLYGLEIDDRAGQLAAFALFMKARSKYRKILKEKIKLNVISIQESNNIDEFTIEKIKLENLKELEKVINIFEDAKEYGSILNIGDINIKKVKDEFELLKKSLGLVLDNMVKERIEELIKQAEGMQNKYDVVVTNPPYMGTKGMGVKLGDYVKKNYKKSKSDLFAVFMEKCEELTKENRYTAMITMHSWMFLSSFEKLRKNIIENSELDTLVHLGARAFEDIGGEVVQTVALVMKKNIIDGKNLYIRLTDYNNAKEKEKEFFNLENRYIANQKDFEKIPGSPIAYWVSDRVKEIFDTNQKLGEMMKPMAGISSGDNETLIKEWSEVDMNKIGFNILERKEALKSNFKWYVHNKGGEFRKWFGNTNHIFNYTIKSIKYMENLKGFRHDNRDYYFNIGLNWAKMSSGNLSARYTDFGCMFDSAGTSGFPNIGKVKYINSLLNSKIANLIFSILNPTLSVVPGNIASLPYIMTSNKKIKEIIDKLTKQCINISKQEWDIRETSWDFSNCQLIMDNGQLISKAYNNYCITWTENFIQMHKNEEELNRLFIEIYVLQDEMTPDVSPEDITLLKKELNDKTGLINSVKSEPISSEKVTPFFNKNEIIKQFISYAVACMMGRYSIDKDGLIMANSDDQLTINNGQLTIKGSDGEIRHEILNARFTPDEDAIIPITDELYFDDDIVIRFEEFVKTVYGNKTLEENLEFIADGIGKKAKEMSRDTLRRYFNTDFIKDHIQRYKKRPIYWLFSSNRKGTGAAFNALVYLHRYDNQSLARMRTEYLHQLQGKIEMKLESKGQILKFSELSAKEKKDVEKDILKLRKQIREIMEYDEQLKDYADKMIELELDDGVLVNYNKFGKLLYKENGLSEK